MRSPAYLLKGTLAVAVLATAYYYLGWLFGSWFHWTPPTWWMAHWKSREAGSVLWLELLNVSMAVVAAIPVAVVLCWIIKASRTVFATLIGATAALGYLAGLELCGYSLINRGSNHQFLLWLDITVHVLSLCLAVPLFVWLVGALPSNKRWKGP